MFFFYRDIFPYLDEDAQDAVYYQEEDESTFVSVPLLAQKLEKEVNNLFNNPQDKQVGATSSPSTILVGLMETMNKVASQLLQLSETEPYGVKGARVILKFRSSNGKEQNIGSFTLDQCTVRKCQNTLDNISIWLTFVFLSDSGQHISNHFGVGADPTIQYLTKELAWPNHQWIQMPAHQPSLLHKESGFVQQRTKKCNFPHMKSIADLQIQTWSAAVIKST